jgi:HEAT repeat protein
MPDLIRCLADQHPGVRMHAMRALHQIGSPAVPHLITACKDTSATIRAGAICALGTPDPRDERRFTADDEAQIFPIVQKALGDESEVVRAAACLAFWVVSSRAKKVPEGVTCLVAALQDPAKRVRGCAASAIGMLARGVQDKRVFIDSVKPLAEMLNDPDEDIRSDSAGALSELGPVAKGIIPVLVAALEANATSTRGTAIEEALIRAGRENRDLTVHSLTQLFRRAPDSECRSSVLFVMRRIGQLPESCVPLLVKALEDKSLNVREHAALCLGDLKTPVPASLPALRKALEESPLGSRSYFAWAYHRHGGKTEVTVPLLLEESGHADPHTREKAVDVLGDFGLGGKPALPVLRGLAQRDANERVRETARRAVRKIEESDSVKK